MTKINDGIPDDPYLWQEYQQADGQAPLPPGYREEMLQAILAITENEAGTSGLVIGDAGLTGNSVIAAAPARIRTFGKWAAAASIILAFGACWLIYRGHQRGQSPSLAATTLSAPSWIGRHNAGHKRLLLSLPDRSTVTLSPEATILYRKDFGQYDKREVKIEGEAVFNVVKNTQMPFVVYSEGVSTTVLGTIFQVTDSLKGSSIKIKLLEGKVMVALGTPAVKDTANQYFLSPGQELLFDKESRNVAIRETGGHSGTYASNRIRYVPGKMDDPDSWYMFNNQGLAEVFDQLSAIYNVEIQYSKEELSHKYFIGRLEKKDSLSKIIRDIALLNNLSVTSRNGRYFIVKRKP